jgi:hypothetical protein
MPYFAKRSDFGHARLGSRRVPIRNPLLSALSRPGASSDQIRRRFHSRARWRLGSDQRTGRLHPLAVPEPCFVVLVARTPRTSVCFGRSPYPAHDVAPLSRRPGKPPRPAIEHSRPFWVSAKHEPGEQPMMGRTRVAHVPSLVRTIIRASRLRPVRDPESSISDPLCHFRMSLATPSHGYLRAQSVASPPPAPSDIPSSSELLPSPRRPAHADHAPPRPNDACRPRRAPRALRLFRVRSVMLGDRLSRYWIRELC